MINSVTISTNRSSEETPQQFSCIQELITYNNYKISMVFDDNVGGKNSVEQIELSLYNSNLLVGYYSSMGNHFSEPNQVSIKPTPRCLQQHELVTLLDIVKENPKAKWKARATQFNTLTKNEFDATYLQRSYTNAKKRKTDFKTKSKQEDFHIEENEISMAFRVVNNGKGKIPQLHQFQLKVTIKRQGADPVVVDSTRFSIISKSRNSVEGKEKTSKRKTRNDEADSSQVNIENSCSAVSKDTHAKPSRVKKNKRTNISTSTYVPCMPVIPTLNIVSRTCSNSSVQSYVTGRYCNNRKTINVTYSKEEEIVNEIEKLFDTKEVLCSFLNPETSSQTPSNENNLLTLNNGDHEVD